MSPVAKAARGLLHCRLFGTKVVVPQPILKALPEALDSKDAKVRDIAKCLAVSASVNHQHPQPPQVATPTTGRHTHHRSPHPSHPVHPPGRDTLTSAIPAALDTAN